METNPTHVRYVNMLLTEQPSSIGVSDINERSVTAHSAYNRLTINGAVVDAESVNHQQSSSNADPSLMVLSIVFI